MSFSLFLLHGLFHATCVCSSLSYHKIFYFRKLKFLRSILYMLGRYQWRWQRGRSLWIYYLFLENQSCQIWASIPQGNFTSKQFHHWSSMHLWPAWVILRTYLVISYLILQHETTIFNSDLQVSKNSKINF
jgi:hypothetical protein